MAKALRIALAAIAALVLIGLAPMPMSQVDLKVSGPGEGPDGG